MRGRSLLHGVHVPPIAGEDCVRRYGIHVAKCRNPPQLAGEVEDMGDMDARFSPKRLRVDSDTRGNGTARKVSEKAADAAAMRALVSRNRGLGDPSVQSAQEAAASRHAASGTEDCFGASVAAKLRRQVEASRATTTTGSHPSITIGARPSVEPLHENTVWLCFPCMQKRGEKSPRVDNDVEKRRCASCSDRPQGIYKLSDTSSASSQTAGTAPGSATSMQQLKTRSYETHLRPAHINVNLARYFASRESEPVNLTALDAGAGGDCLFHCVAAIAEKIVFESPGEASRFEPHLRRDDFLRGKAYLVSKLRTIVADEIIKQQRNTNQTD